MKNKSTAADRKKTKKMPIGAICASVIGVVLIICLVLLLSDAMKDRFLKHKSDFPITEKGSKLFYTPDFDEDIAKDPIYIEKNREIRFTMDGVTSYISEENVAELGVQAKFFTTYFNTVIAGDYENYPSLFTSQYIKKKNAFDKRAQDKKPFTPQKLYDIDVRFMDSKEVDTDDGKVTYSFFNVEYKILKNNGTLRDDLDDEGVIPLVFGLVTQNGKVKINDISTYQKMTNEKKKTA